MLVMFTLWHDSHPVAINPLYVASVAHTSNSPPACNVRIVASVGNAGEFDVLTVDGTVQEVVEKLNGIDNSRNEQGDHGKSKSPRT